MSLTGMPDWSQPLSAGGGDLYFARAEPRRAFAPPLGLRVAAESGAAPALALEVIRLSGAQGPQVLGLLTIRFTGHYALAERQRDLFAVHPEVKLEPLVPREGFLRFQAAAALDIPDELLAPRPLVWTGGGSLTFAARLGQAATLMLNDALVNGMVVVTALAEVAAWGLASRAAARAEFNPAALAGLLEGAESGGRLTQAAVAARLAAVSDSASFSLIGAANDAGRIAAANACAERLIGRYAKLAPADDPTSGAVYVFETAGMADGLVIWDLSDEVMVPRGLILAANPLEAAQQAVASGFRLTREAPVVTFATGLHVLSVFANLPPKRIGVLMLGTEVRVPPCPPDRPQTVTASALFREGETSKSIPIRLSARETVAFDYHTFAFVVGAGGAQRLTGPLLHHEGRLLTLAPDSFPVRFVLIEATQALLSVASLKIRCSGLRDGVPWRVETALDQAVGALAVAVPRDVIDGELTVVATGRDGARSRSLAPRPLGDCWLDLSSFPTAGPACADIVCDFDDDAGLAAIECAPEDRLDDPEAVGLVRLTPANAARQWRWLVLNPLQDGFCWRWFQDPGQPPAPWSRPLDPADGPLALKSSARAQ
jgi:hypothetical protein